MNRDILKARLFLWVIIVVALLAVAYWWQQSEVIAPTVNDNISAEDKVEISAVNAYLTIAGISDEQAVQAVAGQTLLGLMRQLNEADPTFYLETQDYPGLGSLVVQIGGYRNGQDDKYWQYEVNGEMPLVGADQYVIQSGDRIKWEFKESEY